MRFDAPKCQFLFSKPAPYQARRPRPDPRDLTFGYLNSAFAVPRKGNSIACAHHLTHLSRSLLVIIPTRAPSFITGSLRMLCFCINSAASRVDASRSMVMSGAGVMISETATDAGSRPLANTFRKIWLVVTMPRHSLRSPSLCHQHAALLLACHPSYGLQHCGIRSHSGNGIAHQISDLHGNIIPSAGSENNARDFSSGYLPYVILSR